MGQVNVRVNGYNHTIGCRDGEEEHVRQLCALMEEKVRMIRAMGGQFSEARMLLHVALLLADEASDLRADLVKLRNGQAVPAPAPAPPVVVTPPAPPPMDPQVTERLVALAERIETMANHLGKP
ncbi:cell division protein ZapA [Sabulicella rubraurantiaca]|uniref:cell division protein ZapA n=1 Tax=Sabulicella rubraurantiaca TaxID=2811429 RepID=UPI001A96E7C5|nr:cell division protein ZapA [Sabulicella rubraurantiaca]